MFSKLSAIEKSRFYAAIAELENHYGRKAVQAGLEAMDAVIHKHKPEPEAEPGPITLTKLREAAEGAATEQLTLLPEESEKMSNKRTFKGRARYGENKKKMLAWAEDYIQRYPQHDNLPNILIKLYYVDGLNQYQIADRIGVNQRSISEILSGVSGERKQRVIKKWKEVNTNGIK